MLNGGSIHDDLSRPVDNSAEFDDVGISQLHQLIGRLLGSVAAAAIDHDQLIFIGKLRDFFRTNGLVGNHNCARNSWEFFRCGTSDR